MTTTQQQYPKLTLEHTPAPCSSCNQKPASWGVLELFEGHKITLPALCFQCRSNTAEVMITAEVTPPRPRPATPYGRRKTWTETIEKEAEYEEPEQEEFDMK